MITTNPICEQCGNTYDKCDCGVKEASPSSSGSVAICRIKGCGRPVFDLFKDKENTLCSGHAMEALASFAECEWEGDSLKEISEGEQIGALLREKTGIRESYRVNPGHDPLSH